MKIRVLRGSAVLVAAGAFALAGTEIVPQARRAAAFIVAQDDPVALADLGVAEALTQDRFNAEFAAALSADDIDLADSLRALARQRGIADPVDLQARYAGATTTAAVAARAAGEFWRGATSGRGETASGLAGVVVSDVSGYGDVRDLFHEARKAANGEEPDRLVVGLAAVGIAATGATVASLGGALPVRAGVSAVKTAARAGRLSKPLAAHFSRLAAEGIDARALSAAAAAAGRFELASARALALDAVRPATLARFRAVAVDIGTIGRRGGARAAQEALAVAEDAGDLRRIAKLAEARGGGLRATLKLLGRGAFALGAGAVTLAGWAIAGVSWMVGVLLLALAVARRAMMVFLRCLRFAARALVVAVRLTGVRPTLPPAAA